MKIKKIVTIGGTGFIGSYLTNKISKRKNINLSVIYRTIKPDKTLPKVNYLQIDGSKDGKKLGEIIKDSDFLLILTQPNKQLIKNIIKYGSNIRKIIYTSTMLLYADTESPHNEDSLIKPLTEYEHNKYNEELLLIKFAKKYRVKFCIARLANVYGDIQNRGIIQKIFNSLISNSKFIINGDGEQKRDYIFINDVAKLLELLTFSKQKEIIDIFNICTGKYYSINNVMGLIEKISNRKLLIQKNPSIVEKRYILGDNTKIMKLINHFTFTSLRSGLRKTYERSLEQYV